MLIKNSEHKLLLLLEIEKTMSIDHDLYQLLEMLSDITKDLLSVERCSVFVYEEKEHSLVTKYADGIHKIALPVSKGIVGYTFQSGKAQIINDVRNSEYFYGGVDDESGFVTRQLFTQPIYDSQKNIIGVFEAINKIEGEFSDVDFNLLGLISQHISNGIERAKKLRNSNDTLRKEINIALIGKNIELKSRIIKDIKEHVLAQVEEFELIQELKKSIEDNRSKLYILILIVENRDNLDEIEEFSKNANIPIIVIGDDDYDLSLYAGQFNIYTYLSTSNYNAESLKDKIHTSSQNIASSKNKKNRVFSFTGISGGVGTTTVAMNLATLVSNSRPLSNVLYMDFSSTKAISNIFFGIPKPKKDITDILALDDISNKELLDNGLYQIKNNFYFIPGIQSHAEREILFSKDSERAITELIYNLKKDFDYIFIDVGIAEDSELKILLEEMSNDIFVLTELTTAHISILKVYYELIKQVGWRDKIHLVINRSDSDSAISVKDASSIINADESSTQVTFDNSLPNDSKYLRETWNYAELICNKYPKSDFVKALQRELLPKILFDEHQEPLEIKNRDGFFKRLFS